MSYVSELRALVGHMPLQLPGTGVLVYRDLAGTRQYLLQFRSDHKKYGLMGGGIERGETYTGCAVRELKEESGLEITESDLKLLQVYAGPKHVTVHPNKDVVYHTVVLYCHKTEKEVYGEYNPEETKFIRWVTADELKEMLEEDEEKHFFHNNIPIFWDIVNDVFNLE